MNLHSFYIIILDQWEIHSYAQSANPSPQMDVNVPGFGWAAQSSNLKESETKILEGGFQFTNFIDDDEALAAYLTLHSIPASIATSEMSEQAMMKYFSTRPAISSQFVQLLSTNRSNGTILCWDLMDIPPNLQFRLHSHRNVECIRVLGGSIHEWRLQDTEAAKFKTDAFTEEQYVSNLRSLYEGAFEHRVCRHSDPIPYIVNEIGSCHLSYTKEDGALLLVLWSGKHYNYDLAQAEDSRPKNLPVLDPDIRVGYKV